MLRVGFGVTANIDGAIIPGIGTTGTIHWISLRESLLVFLLQQELVTLMSTIDVKITDQEFLKLQVLHLTIPIEYAEGNSITAFSKIIRMSDLLTIQVLSYWSHC